MSPPDVIRRGDVGPVPTGVFGLQGRLRDSSFRRLRGSGPTFRPTLPTAPGPVPDESWIHSGTEAREGRRVGRVRRRPETKQINIK